MNAPKNLRLTNPLCSDPTNQGNARKSIPLFFISFIFMLLLSCVSYAAVSPDSYPVIGGYNQTYNLGENIYTNTETYVTATRAVNSIYSPIVGDLNNDGSPEIIVIDSGAGFTSWTIEVYNTSSLSPVTSYPMGLEADEYASNLVIQDITNDGINDLTWFVIDQNNNEYVETCFLNSSYELDCSVISISASFSVTDDLTMTNCNNDNVCLAVASDVTFPNYIIEAVGYNGTTYNSTRLNIHIDAGDQDGACPPVQRHIAVADVDNDAREEFILSWLEVDDGATLNIEIISVNPLNQALTHETSITQSLGAVYTDANVNCLTEEYMYKISPPLVVDVDGFPSNGLEMVVAVITDDADSEFKMYAFESDGTLLDDYPEVFTASGNYVTNVASARIYDDLGWDFCAMGLNPDDGDTVQLLCADADADQNDRFTVSSPANLTANGYRSHNLLHSVNNDNGNTYSEFATPFAIYSLDFTNNDLDEIYQYPNAPVTSVYAKLFGDEFQNLIYLSDTNMYFVDDGFTNSDCLSVGCITEISYNPCFENPLLRNTTWVIQVTGEDVESDLLNYRVSIYDGLVYEQNHTNYNVTSGATSTFTFTVTNLSQNAVVKVEAWDNENQAQIESKTNTFTVDLVGSVYGESICSDTFLTSETNATTPSGSLITNLLSNSVEGIGTETGLSKLAVWYLVLIVLIGFAGWGSITGQFDPTYGVVISFLFSGFWIIIGVGFNLVPFGHMLTMVMLLAVVGAGVAATITFGHRSGG